MTKSPGAGERPLPRPERWVVTAVKLGRLVERRMQEKLAPVGLTANHYIALSDIAHHPGMSRAELARRLHVTPQAVTGLVEQLAGKRLVVRTEPAPGHSLALDVTEAGHRCLTSADPLIFELSRELLLRCFRPESVTPVERTFQQILRCLRLTEHPRPRTLKLETS